MKICLAVCRPAIALLSIVLVACVSPQKNALFVTKTSLSVLDAETAPAGVSIAFDRMEGYAGPRFSDGTVFPVVAFFETDGQGLSRPVKQTYATGCAAIRIAKPDNPEGIECKPVEKEGLSDEKPVLIFATSTTLGLKLALQATTYLPESFTFGYKRKEASIIPVDKDRKPSVLASIATESAVSLDADGKSDAEKDANSTPKTTTVPTIQKPTTRFKVSQFFATGDAADQLALREDVRGGFNIKVEEALSETQKYRLNESVQGRIALDTLACLSNVPDGSLARVWDNAESLKVFGERGPALVQEIRAPDAKPVVQRRIYTFGMTTLNADSIDHNITLRLHREAVCAIAG